MAAGTDAPSASEPARPRRARLTVLSGPSGVGKDSVVAAMRRADPDLWLSVSCTTRPVRAGERQGHPYRFVSDREFDELVAAHAFLEHAAYAGFRYGTPRAPVEERLAAGVPALLKIELQGARQVRARMSDALLVFLAPPSWEELVRRLTERGSEAPDELAARLAIAEVEMAAAGEFDEVVVNDDIERAATRVLALVHDET
ncbi:MAG: guanylate kinase [Frankia sp.]|nr:guanylate kinase [Frankia sp.]